MNNLISKLIHPNKTELYSFHQKTKIFNLPPLTLQYPQAWKKIYYKTYARFPEIQLPLPKIKRTPLFTILPKRRSTRTFSQKSIPLSCLSTILYYSVGINRLKPFPKRMYPSGGGRYPLEAYCVVLKSTQSLKEGAYHYNVKNHSLETLLTGKKSVANIFTIGSGVNKQMVKEASVVILISAVFGRTQIKYGDHSYRIILLEAGHLMQNIYLTSTALNLGCCAIGGFLDDRANQLLDLEDGKEEVIYLAALGGI